MSESMQSMFRRGLISGKQMDRMGKPAILAKTKPQKSKMADFGQKTKDEGHPRNRGIPEVSTDEINERGVQDSGGKYGTPSKGGRTGAERQFKTNQINDGATQKPKFPAGGKVKPNARQVGVKGPAGKSSGGQYGGPNSRAAG